MSDKTFRVLGTTDEVTECELCGRVELKGTVMLGVLDVDGNITETVYYGASCGAKATGWTTKEVQRKAKGADAAKREAHFAAQAAEAQAIEDAFMVDFLHWVRGTYGVSVTTMSDLHNHRAVTGLSPFGVRMKYENTLR
jgi:hypothetical protein